MAPEERTVVMENFDKVMKDQEEFGFGETFLRKQDASKILDLIVQRLKEQ
jgi:hypothetical protein